jgi:hypothetical protein
VHSYFAFITGCSSRACNNQKRCTQTKNFNKQRHSKGQQGLTMNALSNLIEKELVLRF